MNSKRKSREVSLACRVEFDVRGPDVARTIQVPERARFFRLILRCPVVPALSAQESQSSSEDGLLLSLCVISSVFNSVVVCGKWTTVRGSTVISLRRVLKPELSNRKWNII